MSDIIRSARELANGITAFIRESNHSDEWQCLEYPQIVELRDLLRPVVDHLDAVVEGLELSANPEFIEMFNRSVEELKREISRRGGAA